MAEQPTPGEGRETGPFLFPWRPIVALGALLAGLSAFIVWQQGRAVVHAIDGHTMGSTWSARFVGRPGDDVAAVRSALEAELAELNRQLSGYQPDTALTAFNRGPAGEWQAVPPHLAAVLAAGRSVSGASGGAFDMTIGPLVALWGFGAAAPRVQPPADADIDALRADTGWQRLEASPDGRQWRRTGLASVDVDAIAPGYAADVLSARLAALGHPAHLVEVGGELVARGHRPDGSAWRVGIERPVPERGMVQQVIAVTGAGIATSGDYRDYFEYGGQRYSHTLDPRTGRPVTHGLSSVTVIAPTGVEADAHATAMMVLGPEDGLAYADRVQLAVYLLVRTDDGVREVYNDRFRPYLAGE